MPLFQVADNATKMLLARKKSQKLIVDPHAAPTPNGDPTFLSVPHLGYASGKTRLSESSDVTQSTLFHVDGPEKKKPLPHPHGIAPRYSSAEKAFLKQYPTYASTSSLDKLRSSEFKRLKSSNIVYADYMGGCLYPESLVKRHVARLTEGVLGNTHSDSPTSKASEEYVIQARKAVLSYFDAPEDEYVCIFTSNCTGALKLGGFALEDMLNILQEERKPNGSSLLALTGQSNISGFRPDIPTVLKIAKDLGYYTLLDGAALVSTSSISLSSNPARRSQWSMGGNVDALAVSFYKMFGYPTGIGALIARKEFLRKLQRPWFAGGTVMTVGVPRGVVESDVAWERFEDGTINYTGLVAISEGLALLQKYVGGDVPVLPMRLSTLHTWLYRTLEQITYPNGKPVVSILNLSPEVPAEPSYNIEWNGISVQTKRFTPGYTLSVIFHDASGEKILLSDVSKRAADAGISLRTGCMCNPGGAMALLGKRHMLGRLACVPEAGGADALLTKSDVEGMLGEELGVVRISLGLASNFRDVWEVSKFVASFV
ncbi:PLP-dependent transferase [Serendipita vermifera]|nr:PLP-dependent transferase [Serendipita vermifera]